MSQVKSLEKAKNDAKGELDAEKSKQRQLKAELDQARLEKGTKLLLHTHRACKRDPRGERKTNKEYCRMKEERGCV